MKPQCIVVQPSSCKQDESDENDEKLLKTPRTRQTSWIPQRTVPCHVNGNQTHLAHHTGRPVAHIALLWVQALMLGHRNYCGRESLCTVLQWRLLRALAALWCFWNSSTSMSARYLSLHRKHSEGSAVCKVSRSGGPVPQLQRRPDQLGQANTILPKPFATCQRAQCVLTSEFEKFQGISKSCFCVSQLATSCWNEFFSIWP